MPSYPDGISVQRRRPSLGDDFHCYSIHDSHTSLNRDVSISYRALYASQNRNSLIDGAISAAVDYLLHARNRARPVNNEFHYQYSEEMVSEEDLIAMELIRLRGTIEAYPVPYDWSASQIDLPEDSEPVVPKGKIRRNLPA